MAIIEVNGFKFYDGLSSGCIVVEDGRIDEYIDNINSNDIRCLSINNLYFRQKEIKFLERCPNVESVSISSSTIEDYTGLYSLKKLKVLYSDEPGGEMKLSKIGELEELSIGWNKNIKDLEECVGLKKLRLRKFKSKSGSLEELSNLRNVEELILTQAQISSLKGCGELQSLHNLELNYISKLEIIDEIEKNANTLKSLKFDTCKKIRNHNYVDCLKELELLAFNDCGEIPSIEFIRELQKLKSFIFVNTNIVDGDLSPCVGLEYVGFLNKKHYSHKSEDFKKR